MNKQNKVVAAVIIIIVVIGLVVAYNYSQSGSGSNATDTNTNTAVGNTAVDTTNNTSGTSAGTNTKGGTPADDRTFSNYTLRIGQTTVIKKVGVMPLALTEDSRCPVGTQCVQVGTVRVSVKFSFNGYSQTETVVLNTPITVDGVSGQLISVTPDKKPGVTIAPADYAFVFRASDQ